MLQEEGLGPSQSVEEVESHVRRVGSHPHPTRILIVVDKASFRGVLAHFLSARGLEHAKAESGEEALEKLREGTFALMLLHLTLPDMNGMEVVPKALDVDPDLAIVMLSGHTEAAVVVHCMQQGDFNSLTKPIELTDLETEIDTALRRRCARLQKPDITTELKGEAVGQADEFMEVPRSSHEITMATFKGLLTALDAKREYLGGQSARVASLAARIASQSGYARRRGYVSRDSK